METLLITSKKKSDTRLLVELAKKLGMRSRPLSKAEIEDWILAKEIEKGLRTENISREEIFKTLKL